MVSKRIIKYEEGSLGPISFKEMQEEEYYERDIPLSENEKKRPMCERIFYLGGYCDNSNCAAREVEIKIKYPEIDDVEKILLKNMKCPLCGKKMIPDMFSGFMHNKETIAIKKENGN